MLERLSCTSVYRRNSLFAFHCDWLNWFNRLHYQEEHRNWTNWTSLFLFALLTSVYFSSWQSLSVSPWIRSWSTVDASCNSMFQYVMLFHASNCNCQQCQVCAKCWGLETCFTVILRSFTVLCFLAWPYTWCCSLNNSGHSMLAVGGQRVQPQVSQWPLLSPNYRFLL